MSNFRIQEVEGKFHLEQRIQPAAAEGFFSSTYYSAYWSPVAVFDTEQGAIDYYTGKNEMTYLD